MLTLENIQTQVSVQAKVQAFLDKLTANGTETGVQAAAYHNGELVVDASSGVANPATHQAVGADTLFLSNSASKGVTSTLIHQLVEAGMLDYDTPVAHYWREFGAKGKAGITLRHVLTHEAGIPQTPEGATYEKLADWEWCVHAVEQLEPIWQPGTQTGYHGLTFGVILGELAQRVDGRPFNQIIQDQICAPLGITDLSFGVPPAWDVRIATVSGDRVPWADLPSSELIKRVIPDALEPGPIMNQPAVRRGVMPAVNVFTTARSLARHYAALVGNGVHTPMGNVRLLPPERVRIASALQTAAPDQVMFGADINKALGYWTGGEASSVFGTRVSVFGHNGSGGMIGFADPEYNFSFALLKNKLSYNWNEDTDYRVAQVVRAALGIPD